MTGDRARRPATTPPTGEAPAAASTPAATPSPAAESTRAMIELSPEDLLNESGGWTRGGQPSGKSASNLRRVRVLTDPVKRGPDGAVTGGADDILLENNKSDRFTPPPAGEVIIGGTREELEAASRATTVRLDPMSAAAAVKAATEAAAASGAGLSGSMSGSDVSLSGLSGAAAISGAGLSAPSHVVPPPGDAPADASPRARSNSAAMPDASPRREPVPTGDEVQREPGGSRRSGAVAAASGSMRRRSSAVSSAGHEEPRDWGTIPPIAELVPATPPAVEVRKETLPATQSGGVPTIVPILIAVVLALLAIIFVAT